MVPDALPAPAQAQGRDQDTSRISARREGDGSLNNRLRMPRCADPAKFGSAVNSRRHMARKGRFSVSAGSGPTERPKRVEAAICALRSLTGQVGFRAKTAKLANWPHEVRRRSMKKGSSLRPSTGSPAGLFPLDPARALCLALAAGSRRTPDATTTRAQMRIADREASRMWSTRCRRRPELCITPLIFEKS